ncbi:MAG: hypothetical protein KIT80_10460 [Chitinophagaceae bacterium]|nr:hypothetical protein [Chitinophagaceae bacterium]MCW5927323.1 hypothetical protein [Chitinophagaceae bacterium]
MQPARLEKEVSNNNRNIEVRSKDSEDILMVLKELIEKNKTTFLKETKQGLSIYSDYQKPAHKAALRSAGRCVWRRVASSSEPTFLKGVNLSESATSLWHKIFARGHCGEPGVYKE